MSRTLPQIRALARRLLQTRAGPQGEALPLVAAERVVREMGAGITPLLGDGGFHLLVSRALKKAGQEHPSLRAIRPVHGAERERYLDGADAVAREESAEALGGAAERLIVELIALLARFLGADMAIRLVRECFPEIERDGTGPDAEDLSR
jgi:hypothetical protein